MKQSIDDFIKSVHNETFWEIITTMPWYKGDFDKDYSVFNDGKSDEQALGARYDVLLAATEILNKRDKDK